MTKVLAPFRAYELFLGLNGAVYFSDATEAGDLVLKYYDGEQIFDIAAKNSRGPAPEVLNPDFIEEPFYSFSVGNYANRILPQKNLRLKTRDNEQLLMFRDVILLKFSIGDQIIASNFAPNLFRSVFLPGDNYFLLNVTAGNYSGQLLIDTRSRKHKTLPQETRVYPQMNTNIYTDYCISGSGLKLRPVDGRCWRVQ